MDISPIVACGPNEGMMVLIYISLAGISTGALALVSGMAGVVCIYVGKRKASAWFFSSAGAFAVIAGGVFLWLKAL